MPASMMIADSGGMGKVMGSSSAIVPADPRPGRTPMRFPTTTPIKTTRRLCHVNAVVSPRRTASNTTIYLDSGIRVITDVRLTPASSEREGHIEDLEEEDPGAECAESAGHHDREDPLLARQILHSGDQQRGSHQEMDMVEEEDVGDDGDQHDRRDPHILPDELFLGVTIRDHEDHGAHQQGTTEKDR